MQMGDLRSPEFDKNLAILDALLRHASIKVLAGK